ncbi:hypothetical protein PK35_02800 [Tamlana nanhaiensis]|uniref:Cytochrome c domain-containing protein n=1 Tax=Neotamlana nanhaiensis TaxID=1382798 RepID=A0A0D7W6C5_9FLAO|nr:hypothetical protein [Tamlana nanhaiensis]KJD34706.1 hypothetical protein PK35_02800 [Tamlana nanhaiensis]
MANSHNSFKNYKHLASYIIALILVVVFVISCKSKNSASTEYVVLSKITKKDSLASLAAFEKVYSVLMHPRCMNCHPNGDIPLQGDDSHIHNMLPQRGPDGMGISTMKCANCHASTGVPGESTPPGNPLWHLPPSDMKMVFQGRSPRELALQLVNPKLNGHKNLQELRVHAEDTLVKNGWTMGGNRELPPLTYNEFKDAWYEWIDNGAVAPAN